MQSTGAGGQRRRLPNQQTGKGSNLANLQKSLALAELHLSQLTDPRLVQNIRHGILLLKAQIARVSGVDPSSLDLNSVQESSTGYEFAGVIESTDLNGVATSRTGYEQSVISPFAAFQLAGTLRQKITKVGPPANATPAGSLRHPGTDPLARSNVIRTPNNPTGSGFPVAEPGSMDHWLIEQDQRDAKGGRLYLQGFTPNTHGQDLTEVQRGIVPSELPARGKHGQFKTGYVFTGEV